MKGVTNSCLFLTYAEQKKMSAKYGGPIKTISICSTFHAPHILMMARYWNFLLPETSISIFNSFFAYIGPIVCWSVAWSVSLYHCWIVFYFICIVMTVNCPCPATQVNSVMYLVLLPALLLPHLMQCVKSPLHFLFFGSYFIIFGW